MQTYPLLILHSDLLPRRVQELQQQHENITQRPVPQTINNFVLKDRVRCAATKLTVFDQDDVDQLAYYDSDSIFVATTFLTPHQTVVTVCCMPNPSDNPTDSTM